ncbi:MAG TPA: glycosyltransferase family A protein [Candidatus Binataceae bacterium]|nr:glycosyltransferase family A protein [Candidatus Binataceae bacterium]
MPRVSAIIPVYNGAATIAEAVDSALAQSWRDLEVIVVDDGSNDDTPAILDRYGDRIRVIAQRNRGPAAARNAAARIATGEYLAFLDADDRWLPTMIERCLAELEKAPECVLAYTNLSVVDSGGRTLATSLINGETAHAPTLEEMLGQMWPIMTSGVVIKRAAFDRTGGFREEFTRASFEDIHLWMVAREQGPFRYIQEPMAVWRFSLFPGRLKKAGGNVAAGEVLDRIMRERWGVSAGPLLKTRARAARSILGYIGLLAMREGDARRAREAFGDALRIDPWRVRNLLRLIRTYLPTRVARALSGRTGRASSRPARLR